MKVVFWVIGAVIVVVGLVLGIGVWMFQKELKETDHTYIVQFMKENAEKGRAAISLKYNGETVAAINETKTFPLASTVKIIVAIEYANQAAAGKINPGQKVSLEELNTYYVPKTDGGAHEAWLDDIGKETEIESVTLEEVASGMIAFSSNANTEYLMELLGLQNINEVPLEAGLTTHELLYPIVSSLFIPAMVMKEQGLSKEDTLKVLKDMEMGEYRQRANEFHNSGLAQLTEKEKKQAMKDFNMDFQRIWSDRLTGATVQDYTELMRKLNSKEYFSKAVHQYLDPVLEQPMKNPKNQQWLTHLGQKGGSTAFVLTMAMYAKDKKGNETELALFTDDLTDVEQAKLSRNLNEFQLKFLNDADFRAYVKSELKGISRKM